MACDKYLNDYKNIPWYSNRPTHFLQKELFKRYKYLRYKQIINIASIHKLTRKHKTNNTKGLVYHYILDKYNSFTYNFSK